MTFIVNGDELRLLYAYGARYEADGYEPEIHSLVTGAVDEDSTFMDVGAHVGFFTMAAAVRGARVVAFEASPLTAQVLREHVRLNELGSRVTVVEAVVSDSEGETSFYVDGDTMSASISRAAVDELSAHAQVEPAQEIRRSAVTLDGYCTANGVDPTLVKIDVEGAELRVLRGAAALLASDTAILCEVHPHQLTAAGASEAELLEVIASSGRRVDPVDDPNSTGIYHAWLIPQ